VAASLGTGLRRRWLAWRNHLLASPRFQRWAADFPPTRPIAQRRARQLFDITAGFVYSQILFACVRLGLLPLLAPGPRELHDLVRDLDLPAAAALRLLKAAASLGLVEPWPGGGYALGPQGAALLGNPGIAAMVEHHAMLYRDLADPVALLRGQERRTDLGSYWSYAAAPEPAGLGAHAVAAYTHLMSASQSLVAGDILDAYSLAGHRCLLDVGGGDGGFVASVAARWPQLQLRLFDLPPVAALAQARFERLGLAGRASAQGGDMLSDPLPRGADIVSLVRVAHDHDDAAVMRLFGSIHAALPPGGTFLLAEPMAATPGAEPMGEAYFGFYLLAMGSGRPRTPKELKAMLREVGFERVRLRRTRRPLLSRVLTARVP
jgi:demethylspheroidene O-methyltransferase